MVIPESIFAIREKNGSIGSENYLNSCIFRINSCNFRIKKIKDIDYQSFNFNVL